MASSEREKLLGDDPVTPDSNLSPISLINQNSMQFDISANSDAFIELLQNKNFSRPFQPEPEVLSNSDQSDEEEVISADAITSPLANKRKQLSNSISEYGVQNYQHRDPVLVLTDMRQLTLSNSYYGLLTCRRYLQQKNIRSKLDVIGVKKKIETGSYSGHTSEYLHVLYEFQKQKAFNDMCTNLMTQVSKFINKKTKNSDRIPISLQPARPIYSKLKCCLELSIAPKSFDLVIDALQPLFATLSLSLFYIKPDLTEKEHFIPNSTPIPPDTRLPAFALCMQFNKVIFPDTLKQFHQKSWSAVSVFPSNKSLFCYASSVYGDLLPYILCETGKEAGMFGSRRNPDLAIYLFVSGDGAAMSEMRVFYDILLSDDRVKPVASNRIIYPLLTESFSDRELVLLHVPDKTTVLQNALSLYVHTDNILSLMAKLNRPFTECEQHCVSLTDPQGNRIVLRDLSHSPFFKSAADKLEFTT